MKILCLDLVMNKSGYAIYENNKLCDYGIINAERIKEDKENIHSKKLLFIHSLLQDLENKHNFDIVIIEDSFVHHNKATKALSKVRGIAELVFCNKDIILYPTRLIKKSITDNGNATKLDMINKINEIYDLKNNDDNIADAIALGYHHINKN